MNWRKAAAWAAGVVAVGAVAAVAAFHAMVDPERLAERMRERTRDSWGRELTLGSISLELLPRPAMRATQVTLSNPEWAKDRHFLVADSVAANFELLPLLIGRVQVQSLFLDGARLSLEAGRQGTTFPRREQAQPANADTVPFPTLNEIRVRSSTVRNRTPEGKLVEWVIDSADLETDGGLKDVKLEARVSRNGQPFEIGASLEDASRFNKEGAASPGKVVIKGKALTATLDGRIPLHRALKGHDLKAKVEGANMDELFTFLGIKREKTSAVAITFESKEKDGVVTIPKLDATLGKLRFTGDARLVPGERIKVDARLASDRLDWAQAFLDSGGKVIPDPPSDKLYSDRPMAWRLVEALKEKEGTVDVALKSARLRNGVELSDARIAFAFNGPVLEVKSFTAKMLGGTAKGSMSFAAPKKAVKIRFEGQGLLLERFLKERGSKVPFTGGPMAISADIAGAGESMQDVAASITGPITVRMGRGTWHSQRAGDVENLMTNAFAAKGSGNMELVCIGAKLPFRDGRARAETLVGGRSEASRLVGGGTVDFREGKLDLRGKVAAQKGVTLGLSTIANDIVIAGPLRKPGVSLDASGAPAAIARVGAAIATAGASLIGTAIAEAATEKNDPCEVVFK